MSSTSKIITALVAGAAVGVVLGVLFAPEAGTETRKKLSDEGKRMADSLREKLKQAEGVREKVNEYANS